LSGKRKPVRSYAAFFFAAWNFAQRARAAAAIFLRPDADMVRLAGAEPVTAFAGCDTFRIFAHRALCAWLLSLADCPVRHLREDVFCEHVVNLSSWAAICDLKVTPILAPKTAAFAPNCANSEDNSPSPKQASSEDDP
jgi:hypothetical protein